MKCSCCGKKKGFFESFEELDKSIYICVNCSKILYKYQDAVKDRNFEQAETILKELDYKKFDKVFSEWLEKYQERLGVSNDIKTDNENEE